MRDSRLRGRPGRFGRRCARLPRGFRSPRPPVVGRAAHAPLEPAAVPESSGTGPQRVSRSGGGGPRLHHGSRSSKEKHIPDRVSPLSVSTGRESRGTAPYRNPPGRVSGASAPSGTPRARSASRRKDASPQPPSRDDRGVTTRRSGCPGNRSRRVPAQRLPGGGRGLEASVPRLGGGPNNPEARGHPLPPQDGRVPRPGPGGRGGPWPQSPYPSGLSTSFRPLRT